MSSVVIDRSMPMWLAQEVGQARRQPAGRKGRRQVDHQLPGVRVLALEAFDHGLDVLERGVHRGGELPARGSEFDPAMCAMEHRHAEPFLELLDLAADGTLSHVQSLRRPG